jgi:hypothetical protein
MISNLERYKEDLESLIAKGKELATSLMLPRCRRIEAWRVSERGVELAAVDSELFSGMYYYDLDGTPAHTVSSIAIFAVAINSLLVSNTAHAGPLITPDSDAMAKTF